MSLKEAIAVVIPSYRVTPHILDVIAGMGAEVDRIYVVDDKCRDGSAAQVRNTCTDPRVKVIEHAENQGVGGAVMTVIVKMDGDGQMAPRLIAKFVAPILSGEAHKTTRYQRSRCND
jgi:dolichol-phosphate mannosyltransferase